MTRHILHLRLDEPDGAALADAAALLDQITPYVQIQPSNAADLDITGATGYFELSPLELAHLVHLRLAAHLGASASIGVAGNRMLATMTAAANRGQVSQVEGTPEAVAGFLRPLPTRALPGIGPGGAILLVRHGLRTVGALADTPLPTVQRLLGNAAGRSAHQRAHGIDTRPVTPWAPPLHLSGRRVFDRDELNPLVHRRAVLALADELALRLRRTRRAARRITLGVRYADGSVTWRSRSLPRPVDHTPELARAARLIYQGLGLQRARVRGIELRVDDLVEEAAVSRQLSIDPREQRLLALQEAMDRARARFGPAAVLPAELAHPADGQSD